MFYDTVLAWVHLVVFRIEPPRPDEAGTLGEAPRVQLYSQSTPQGPGLWLGQEPVRSGVPDGGPGNRACMQLAPHSRSLESVGVRASWARKGRLPISGRRHPEGSLRGQSTESRASAHSYGGLRWGQARVRPTGRVPAKQVAEFISGTPLAPGNRDD